MGNSQLFILSRNRNFASIPVESPFQFPSLWLTVALSPSVTLKRFSFTCTALQKEHKHTFLISNKHLFSSNTIWSFKWAGLINTFCRTSEVECSTYYHKIGPLGILTELKAPEKQQMKEEHSDRPFSSRRQEIKLPCERCPPCTRRKGDILITRDSEWIKAKKFVPTC